MSGQVKTGESDVRSLATVRDSAGRIEYVLLPVALYRQLRSDIEYLLGRLPHSTAEAAPDDDEPVTEEEETLVEEARQEIARGEGMTTDELRRRLGA